MSLETVKEKKISSIDLELKKSIEEYEAQIAKNDKIVEVLNTSTSTAMFYDNKKEDLYFLAIEKIDALNPNSTLNISLVVMFGDIEESKLPENSTQINSNSTKDDEELNIEVFDYISLLIDIFNPLSTYLDEFFKTTLLMNDYDIQNLNKLDKVSSTVLEGLLITENFSYTDFTYCFIRTTK